MMMSHSLKLFTSHLLTTLTVHHTFTVSSQAHNSPFPQIYSASIHLDCLLGLYWTGLTLVDGFSFLVNFLGRAVD